MLDWLAASTAVNPEKVALVIGEQHWTYAQLNRRVDNLCRHLRGLIGPEEPAAGEPLAIHTAPIAALLPNCLVFVCLIHAAARLGITLAPLNTRLAPAELEWQLAHLGCQWLLYNEATAAKVAPIANGRWQGARIGEEWLVAAAGSGKERKSPPPPLPAAFRPDAIQAIVFTSGSSGRPKGALLTFANHFWSATASAFRLGLLPADRWLTSLPLYHVGGLAILFRCCLYGTTAVIHESFDLAAFNHSLDHEQISLVSLVPTMLHRLLASRTHWPTSLRLILLGGAAADPALIEQANALPRASDKEPRPLIPSFPLIAPTYGLTEAASQVATMLPAAAARKPGSVGKPLLFTSLRIVAEDGRDQPPGQYGEIVVSGPTVMAGYFEEVRSEKLPVASQPPTANLHPSALILHPSTIHTGDIGYLDEDGDLWLVQRRTDLIVSGGENVYPAEVEAALKAHPAVSQACVVGVPHPEWGQQVAAAVVLQPGATLTATELGDFCREQLAGYKRPRLLRFLDHLPETASGKIQRQAVAELWPAGARAEPATDVNTD